MSWLFPLAHAANAYATTVFLIVLALCGRSDVAAEVGLIQAATQITFHAFSGDARSLLLRIEGRVAPETLLAARILLVLPLAAIAWFLSAGVSLAAAPLATIVILRRACEGLNELSLADGEFHGRRREAIRNVVVQAVLLIGAIAGMLWLDERGAAIGLLVWAAGPLLVGLPFLRRTARATRVRSLDGRTLRSLSPHLGSTVIMAVSTYVFRALIVALAGKETAGDLITAFSLGGLLASVFAIAAGPSLTFLESPAASRRGWSGLLSKRMAVAAGAWFAAGLAIVAIPAVASFLARSTGKSPLFWEAVGASLCGGAVMLVAWRARFRILQHDGNDAFGPDVLANVIVLFAVPLLHSVLGVRGLSSSYLVTASASAVFYLGALRTGSRGGRLPTGVLTGILAGLALPVFFQPAAGLFRDPRALFDPAGRFALTPLPVSIAACFAGIVLCSHYSRARRGLWMLFFTTAVLTFATLASSGDDPAALRVKLTLMLQVLLPLPALALGEMLGTSRGFSQRLAIVCLAVSGIIAPAQCVASRVQGHWHLQPNVFVFSIYHYLQYVPVVLVSMFLLAVFRLFGSRRWRPWVIAAAPGVAVYAVASLSMGAMGLLVAGMAAFCVKRVAVPRRRSMPLFVSATAAAFVLAVAVSSAKSEMLVGKVALDGQYAVNLVGRLPCWRFYATAVATRPGLWLAGHPTPPPREQFPSAHNLPLDLAYNFGLPGVLPFAALAVFTLSQLIRHRQAIVRRPDLAGLALVVVLAVWVDNLFKVGLRQPFSGIFGCFAWGVLLARMERLPCGRPTGTWAPASTDATDWHGSEVEGKATEAVREVQRASTAAVSLDPWESAASVEAGAHCDRPDPNWKSEICNPSSESLAQESAV